MNRASGVAGRDAMGRVRGDRAVGRSSVGPDSDRDSDLEPDRGLVGTVRREREGRDLEGGRKAQVIAGVVRGAGTRAGRVGIVMNVARRRFRCRRLR